jgi:hypothetical protein
MNGAEMLLLMGSVHLGGREHHGDAGAAVHNLDGSARQHTVVTRGDDALTRRQTLVDKRQSTFDAGYLHVTQLCPGCGRDDIDIESVGTALHGLVRNHDDIRHGVDQKARGD